MGRAKEKILAHKKAREEAKNVKKQVDDGSCGGSSKRKPKEDSEENVPSNVPQHSSKAKSKPRKSPAFKTGNPNYGPIKPTWRSVASHNLATKNLLSQVNNNNGKEAVESGEELGRTLTVPDILTTDDLKLLGELLPTFPYSDMSPTVAAVALNRFDLIKKLVRENSIDYDYSDKVLTPMGVAIRLQNWDMINYLVEKQLNVHSANAQGCPVLVEAALQEAWDALQFMDLYLLVQHDPDLDLLAADVQGLTISHALAKRGWVSSFQAIIPPELLTTRQSKNIVSQFVEATTTLGITPIMLAAQSCHAETIQYLISHGATVFGEDKLGFSGLCRVLLYVYNRVQSGLEWELDPSSRAVISALNGPHCTMDMRSYLCRRLQVILNHAWARELPTADGENNFHALSKAPFFFYAAFLAQGVQELISSKLISRLVQAGLKHLDDSHYLSTICEIFFDFLVCAYEEPDDIYDMAVNEFVVEGAADFCSKIMLRAALAQPAGEGKTMLDATSLPGITDEEREAFPCETQRNAKDRNTNVAAMLPFIQIMDHPKIQNWLALHFTTMKEAYYNFLDAGSPPSTFNCNLRPGQCRRLEINAFVWEMLWNGESFVTFQALISRIMPRDTSYAYKYGSGSQSQELQEEAELSRRAAAVQLPCGTINN